MIRYNVAADVLKGNLHEIRCSRAFQVENYHGLVIIAWAAPSAWYILLNVQFCRELFTLWARERKRKKERKKNSLPIFRTITFFPPYFLDFDLRASLESISKSGSAVRRWIQKFLFQKVSSFSIGCGLQNPIKPLRNYPIWAAEYVGLSNLILTQFSLPRGESWLCNPTVPGLNPIGQWNTVRGWTSAV